MALTHLVDTSVLTRLSAGSVRTALEPLAAGERVARAGISDLEVAACVAVTGARGEAIADSLR